MWISFSCSIWGQASSCFLVFGFTTTGGTGTSTTLSGSEWFITVLSVAEFTSAPFRVKNAIALNVASPMVDYASSLRFQK
jgi:hypothetical protein